MHTSGHHGEWTVQVSGQYPAPQEQVSSSTHHTSTHKSTHAPPYISYHTCAGRFGSGLTLQAKVKMLSQEGFEAKSLHKPDGRRSRSGTRTPDPPPDVKYFRPLGKEITLADPYDTTSLHIFIRENFHNAFLVEEHQVRCGGHHLGYRFE